MFLIDDDNSFISESAIKTIRPLSKGFAIEMNDGSTKRVPWEPVRIHTIAADPNVFEVLVLNASSLDEYARHSVIAWSVRILSCGEQDGLPRPITASGEVLLPEHSIVVDSLRGMAWTLDGDSCPTSDLDGLKQGVANAAKHARFLARERARAELKSA